MLILTRRQGESIIIRDDIIVTVLGIEGGSVRLGVDAPKSVEIWREEIWDKKQTGEWEESNGNS